MNESPSNHTGTGFNETFSSQPSQTNPFTADLKGEFTSNFGTNTNAVSQIFKEGGFTAQNKNKYIIIGVVAVVVLAIVFFVVTREDSPDSPGEDVAATDEAPAEGEDAQANADGEKDPEAEAEAGAADAKTADGETAEAEGKAEGEAAQPEAGADTAAVPTSVPKGSGGPSIGGGAITLTEPADGSSLNYDETQGPATFNWSGGGGYIIFSRSQSMNPPIMKVAVSGNSYSFHHPWPGTWYWKVENRSGSTEVRSFKVNAPARRNVQLQAPAAGGAVAGSGGTVSWQGDANVAFYRVEFSTGGWANPQHRFASSGNSVQLNGVAAGAYQMRVGAYSEVSGRWEYTDPVSVTVQ